MSLLMAKEEQNVIAYYLDLAHIKKKNSKPLFTYISPVVYVECASARTGMSDTYRLCLLTRGSAISLRVMLAADSFVPSIRETAWHDARLLRCTAVLGAQACCLRSIRAVSTSAVGFRRMFDAKPFLSLGDARTTSDCADAKPTVSNASAF